MAQGAGLLEPVGPAAKNINGVGVHREADIKLPGGTTRVYLTGAGLRKKKLAVIPVNVYVMASYLDTKEPITRSNPMESIARSRVRAVRMTLTRNVTARQIRESFEDSLDANGIDLEAPPIRKLLDSITFPVADGTNVDIIATGDEVLVDVPNHPRVSSTGSGLGVDFWKMWFGVPVDSQMGTLKQELMTPIADEGWDR